MWIKRSFYLAASAGAVMLLSCGSDDPAQPEDPGTPQPGHVYNWAGTGAPGYGAMGQPPAQTQLYWPQDVTFAPDGSPVVLDWNNHRVIATDASGEFKLIVGVADGDFGDPCPGAPAPCEDVVATNAKLNHPTHVVFDPANGDMILCAWHNSMLMRLDMVSGLMDRFCGSGARAYNGDDQPAATAFVDLPVGLTFDSQGRLVFGDQANMIIRMIDENGIIHTIAGTQPVFNGTSYVAQFGFSGDEGPATAAKFSFERGQIADPSGKICYDASWNLYIADTQNHCIRVVDTNGIIHRFAGVGPSSPGFAGDGGLATSASLYQPRDVAADGNGNIFIADTGNHVIRMVKPDGTISTVAGQPRPLNALPLPADQVRAENGKHGLEIHLASPFGVEADSRGRVWISDTEHNLVRILYR
jgi:hypothetical protein